MENKTNFFELVRNVDDKKILIPDFQREFVWKDEEQQTAITASVLAKMPIGSILLLESKPKEYACKVIGCNTKVDTSVMDQHADVQLLLDGQQRITVLTNVFSNVIQNNALSISDLASTSLKRKFFLRLPKWESLWDNSDLEQDLFGIRNLNFPLESPESDIPNFLSGDLQPFIEVYAYLKDDGKPYNPSTRLTTALDHFCVSNESGYLVPLFLAVAPNGPTKAGIQLRYKEIIDAIGNEIFLSIKNYYVALSDNDARKSFAEEFFFGSNIEDIVNDSEKLMTRVDEASKYWAMNLKNYIESCLKDMSLNQFVVSEKERKRAIDIYENLNLGGVSLNTFDLIMARVAVVNKNRFYDRVINNINCVKDYYPEDVLPDNIARILKPSLADKKYNASKATMCYKNDISTLYLNAFIDVLSLYCNNLGYDPDLYNVGMIKRETILKLAPDQIDQNTERVCDSLDKALFFFQTRCGIRTITEIKYILMLVIVATIFTDDQKFEDKHVHDILEAWYWSAMFSGEFDKDQNETMKRNLVKLFKTINGESTSWINDMKNLALKAVNYSDEDLLLMKKVDEDRFPKGNLRYLVCQFFLSKTYADMFEDGKRLSVFSSDADEFEAHHIIPLGSVTTYGESTEALRKNPQNLCNSPLNFVFITKKANGEISDAKLSDYVTKLKPAAKTALHIDAYGAASDPMVILSARYDSLLGDVVDRIDSLLQ